MTAKHSKHPLAISITSVGWLGYPISDNIKEYLDFLYKRRLHETLKIGFPEKCVILNLTEAYAEISEIIFWQEDEYYDEALKAFPLFVDYILETELEIYDLYNVSRIVSNFFDDENKNGPKHLQALRSTVQNLSTIFQQEKYKNSIYASLQDKSRSDYFELISIATDFYGEDEFELCFSVAKYNPKQALEWSYWILGMDEGQCQRFIEWARNYMPIDRLGQPVYRNYQYNETEKAVLENILSNPEKTLKNSQDRHDFLTWGLSSTDKFLSSKAAWLLEDIQLSEWPDRSTQIITELFNEMEPNWTTLKKADNHFSRYVKIKERLEKLLQKDSRQ